MNLSRRVTTASLPAVTLTILKWRTAWIGHFLHLSYSLKLLYTNNRYVKIHFEYMCFEKSPHLIIITAVCSTTPIYMLVACLVCLP